MTKHRKERKRNPKHRMPPRKSGLPEAYTPIKCPTCDLMAVFIFMAIGLEAPMRRPYCRHCEKVIGRDIHLPISLFSKTFLPRHWRD